MRGSGEGGGEYCQILIFLGSGHQLEGAGQVLASLEGGGGTESFGVVLTQVLEVLTIRKGWGHGRFPPFKRRT